MSPHPTSVNTPMTPSLENADKNTPAPTPTDQHESRVPESPYTQPSIVNSVEPPQNLLSSQPGNHDQQATQTCANPSISPDGGDGGISSLKTSTPKPDHSGDRLTTAPGPSSCDSTSITSSIVSLLKRPLLCSRDYENIVDEDYNPRQLLYDYSSWEEWMEYPVKRFKPNDEQKPNPKPNHQGVDLYADEVRSKGFDLSDQVLALPTNILADAPSIKSEPGISRPGVDGGGKNADLIKTESLDDDGKDGNLLTEKGLQPSYNDLDQIFDNSDDASNDETVINPQTDFQQY